MRALTGAKVEDGESWMGQVAPRARACLSLCLGGQVADMRHHETT